MMSDRQGSTSQEQAPVLLIEHACSSGRVVAEARLNAPATLNALSLEMIDQLALALRGWAQDDRVACVVLSSVGDRAFSAGGDIQALYHAMLRNHQAGNQVDPYPYEFFEREYRLDYLLHTFDKPVVALGHGVIMGGGLGIFSAARFRVVAENVRIALPEISVGLFPDAGASWLLRNMEAHFALFLGMTGNQMNQADAMLVGLGTHSLSAASLHTITDNLVLLEFSGDTDVDRSLLDEFLDVHCTPVVGQSEVAQVPPILNPTDDLAMTVGKLKELTGVSAWLDRGIVAMSRGCPVSVGIVVEQLKRARHLDLADCFRMEMIIATHCANNVDFAEGIRALLIDKDNRPDWRYGELSALADGYVLSHFKEPWAENPLRDLEPAS